MNDDLETLLRQSSTLTLDRPVSAVIARGDRLRRRRRRGLALAVTGAAAVLALGSYGAVQALVDTAMDDSSAVSPPADIHPVDFSGRPTDLSPTQLNTLSGACLRGDAANVAAGVERIPDGTWPTVVETRPGKLEAIFHGDEYDVLCNAKASTSDGTPDPADANGAAVMAYTWRETMPDPEVGMAITDADPPQSETAPCYLLQLPKNGSVSSVRFFGYDGGSYKATIVGDIAVAWAHPLQVPAKDREPSSGTFRAYDVEGNLIAPDTTVGPQQHLIEASDVSGGTRLSLPVPATVTRARFVIGAHSYAANVAEGVASVVIKAGKGSPEDLLGVATADLYDAEDLPVRP